jgi:Na+-transporting methylmalonyl-CoA/oxaloacetate decarboxylase gamma subunit
MENLGFGTTLLVVGMGGTLVTLGLLALLIKGLVRLLPPPASGEKPGND